MIYHFAKFCNIAKWDGLLRRQVFVTENKRNVTINYGNVNIRSFNKMILLTRTIWKIEILITLELMLSLVFLNYQYVWFSILNKVHLVALLVTVITVSQLEYNISFHKCITFVIFMTFYISQVQNWNLFYTLDLLSREINIDLTILNPYGEMVYILLICIAAILLSQWRFSLQ